MAIEFSPSRGSHPLRRADFGDENLAEKSVSRYVPLTDFVLLERIDEDMSMSKDGIHIPQVAQVQSNKGRVIAVGEGRLIGAGQIQAIPLEPGDIVLFSKYGAEEVMLDGDTYLLLRYDEIKLKQRSVLA